jgi:hypothetical protein
MSVSVIGSVGPAAVLPEIQKVAATPAATKPAAASTPTDTVTLSSAAQKAPKTGDVDHDGDSH